LSRFGLIHSYYNLGCHQIDARGCAASPSKASCIFLSFVFAIRPQNDLTLELDAVRAVLGHGLPSFESPARRSILSQPDCPPQGAHSTPPERSCCPWE